MLNGSSPRANTGALWMQDARKLYGQKANYSVVDVYDVQTGQGGAAAAVDDEDGGANDRIAEEFRREFMDAQSRQQQEEASVECTQGLLPNPEREVLKGPARRRRMQSSDAGSPAEGQEKKR